MIRINLVSMERPRKKRAGVGMAMPAGAGFLMTAGLISLALAVGTLFALGYTLKSDLDEELTQIDNQKKEKARLQKIKEDVDRFQAQKKVLEQRLITIEELRRNKAGGQELLDMFATTVARTEAMWLTGIKRVGNSLVISGTAATIGAVANYITQLKRSGYFDKVEITEAKQDDENVAVQTFWFTLTADITQPKPAGAPAGGSGTAAPAKKS